MLLLRSCQLLSSRSGPRLQRRRPPTARSEAARLLLAAAPHRYYTAMSSAASSHKRANGFLDFVNASPTPFHAVESAKGILEKAGFTCIKERDSWASTLKAGGKYYLTRNGTSIVAFAIGEKWKPGNPVAMIGAHTDSPTFRVKPISRRQNEGFLQVSVEPYARSLSHSWFDRDLSLAGRVFAKNADGTVSGHLVKIERPILRIPSLAIHLDPQTQFSPNKETQMVPITGLVSAELNRQQQAGVKKSDTSSDAADVRHGSGRREVLSALTPAAERHHLRLVEVVADEAGVKAEDIEDFELVLYDTQRAVIGGLNEEFIFSARLDNLMMSFCTLAGLVDSLQSPSALKDDHTIRLICLFDNEECGSTTAQGANSDLLPAVLRRISAVPLGSSSSGGSDIDNQSATTSSGDESSSYERVSASGDGLSILSTAYEQTMATSFLISADMAHSVHPNYPANYEQLHRPEMNAGTVIKVNVAAKYATSSPGIVLVKRAAELARGPGAGTGSGVPLQIFVVRNDSPCGSTIGPMLAAKLGARTLDLGNAQLAMHSCREMCGVYDVEYATALFASFLENYGQLKKLVVVD